MSLASASRTIKWISKGGTYTAQMVCANGDLYQDYSKEGDTVTCYPDWSDAANQPTVYLYIVNSLSSMGTITPSSVDYYFNDQLIPFTNGKSTGLYAGLFETVAATTENPYVGIKITGNLVVAANYTSCMLKMVARVTQTSGSSSSTDEIQASFPINIQEVSADAYRVVVGFTGDTYAIVEDGGSVTMIARAFKGTNELTSGLAYKWYTLDTGGWVALSGKTAQTLAVDDSMIGTYGQFKAEVYQDGTLLGFDIQGVLDATDPYEIDACPTPEDETVVEFSGTGVNYTPELRKRGSDTKVEGITFYFTLLDPSGNVLNDAAHSPGATPSHALTTFDVTYEMMAQANADASLWIETVQETVS